MNESVFSSGPKIGEPPSLGARPSSPSEESLRLSPRFVSGWCYHAARVAKVTHSEITAVADDLDNLSVVLVATRHPGNIGSAARAMKNMGVRDLILVAPETSLSEESWRLAGKASDVLERIQIFKTLDEAVHSMHLLVAATSARERRLSQTVLTPRQAATEIRPRLKESKVALLFGSERSGLSDELLARCQFLISIPTAGSHPVLNLSQAILLCCYEIFLSETSNLKALPQSVSQGEREALYQQIQAALIQIGFLSSTNPQPVMKAIRSFWGGASMTSRDLRILRGIMSHMDWYVREGFLLGPEAVRKH